MFCVGSEQGGLSVVVVVGGMEGGILFVHALRYSCIIARSL